MAEGIHVNHVHFWEQEEEMQQAELEPAVQPPHPAILLQSASFAWEAVGRLTLRNVNLQVRNCNLTPCSHNQSCSL